MRLLAAQNESSTATTALIVARATRHRQQSEVELPA